MPLYQASVFQSSLLEHGTRFHFRNPHNSQPGWIWGNVSFPDTMSSEIDDKRVIRHVVGAVMAGFFAWSNFALYGQGGRWISFPIKVETPEQNSEKLTGQLLCIAAWHGLHIEQRHISIDKRMIFKSCEGPSEREDQMLVEPAHWNKPEFATVDPWSVITELQD